MKIFLIAILATLSAIILILGNRFLDRDSLVFRGISKIIFPVSQKYVNAGSCRISNVNEFLDEPIDDWNWINDESVAYQFGDTGLRIVAKEESVWWKNKRAAFYYCYMQGNGSIEVSVATRRTEILSQYPNRHFQFGGVILRDPRSNAFFSRENYVFNVIGYRGERLQIESKSTENGRSHVDGYDWLTGDARVRIERHGSQIEMLARLSESDDWVKVNSFERPDLPEKLEVGLIAYSFSHGKGDVDLTATFSSLNVVAK